MYLCKTETFFVNFHTFKSEKKAHRMQQYLSRGDRRSRCPSYAEPEREIRRPSKPNGLPRFISNSYTFWIRIYISYGIHTRRTWETFKGDMIFQQPMRKWRNSSKAYNWRELKSNLTCIAKLVLPTHYASLNKTSLISNSYTFWIRIYISYSIRTWETFLIYIRLFKVQLNSYNAGTKETKQSVCVNGTSHLYRRTFRQFHRKNIFSEKQSQFFCMTHPLLHTKFLYHPPFFGHFFSGDPPPISTSPPSLVRNERPLSHPQVCAWSWHTVVNVLQDIAKIKAHFCGKPLTWPYRRP